MADLRLLSKGLAAQAIGLPGKRWVALKSNRTTTTIVNTANIF